ncbi:MAG: hypothetical protein LBB31_01570, partial [Prevotellaceae bacterium]|nr:hypothetical protein [Prevotellaceae bacterium]
MQSYEFQKLQHAIAAIRKERLPRNVKCDIIGSYDDFLREKDNLKTHYHFSLPVFNALVKLAGELLDSGRRFGRVELLNTMQQYLKRGNHKLDETAKTNLFGLFKKILDDNNMSYLAGICFLMLQDFSLSAEYEAWLCEKMEHYATEYYTPTSEMLFRRILNHPTTSTTITKWVSENFNHPIFRFQRYKAIAWL